MRRLLIALGFIIVIIIGLFLFWGIFLVNRETTNYKSTYNYTDSETLKRTIEEDGDNAIVIITSPNCSGAPTYMPKIENEQSHLNERKIKVYYVVQMLNTDIQDSVLKEEIQKYHIQYIPLIISPAKHPSGNLFNTSRKYSTFLTELCSSCNDGSLGYPLYIYYKKGVYMDKSYSLNESILSKLN